MACRGPPAHARGFSFDTTASAAHAVTHESPTPEVSFALRPAVDGLSLSARPGRHHNAICVDGCHSSVAGVGEAAGPAHCRLSGAFGVGDVRARRGIALVALVRSPAAPADAVLPGRGDY